MIDRPLMVRSKNAGPFTLTIDLMFDDPADAAELYDVLTSSETEIATGPLSAGGCQVFLDRRAAAVKITMGRTTPAGSFGDLDLYGCQQHVGILRLLETLGPRQEH